MNYTLYTIHYTLYIIHYTLTHLHINSLPKVPIHIFFSHGKHNSARYLTNKQKIILMSSPSTCDCNGTA